MVCKPLLEERRHGVRKAQSNITRKFRAGIRGSLENGGYFVIRQSGKNRRNQYANRYPSLCQRANGCQPRRRWRGSGFHCLPQFRVEGRDREKHRRGPIARQLRQQVAKLSSIDLTRLPTDRASYGSTLVLRDLDRDTEITYRLVTPEEADYEHDDEGADDSTSHIRMVLTHSSETVPIADGKMQLGTWQGIFLFEHRKASHGRRIQLTIIGK